MSTPDSAGYYLRIRGHVSGPHSIDELDRMQRQRQVTAIHEISSDRRIWQPLSSWTVPRAAPVDPPPTIAIEVVSALPVVERGPILPVAVLPDVPARSALRSRRTVAARRATSVAFPVALAVALIIVGLIVHSRRGSPESQHAAVASAPPIVTDYIGVNTAPDDLGDALGLVVAGAIVTHPDGRRAEVMAGTGTAFAVASDGTMLTNRHVVDPAINLGRATAFREELRREQLIEVEPRVWVFVRGEKLAAEIDHASDRFDLAVLRVGVSGGVRFKRVFRLARSADVSRQCAIRALGYPAAANDGLSEKEVHENWLRRARSASADLPDVRQALRSREIQFVLTTGTVSRTFDDDEGQTRRWIQHNADINPGSSGGPLIDARGVVVGINSLTNTAASGTHFSLSTAQLATELDRHAPAIVWVTD